MSQVRIILDETQGVPGRTWVTVVPIKRADVRGVWDAVDLAAEMFKMNTAGDREAISDRVTPPPLPF